MPDAYKPSLEIIQFADGNTAYLLKTLPTVAANDVVRWLALPPTRFTIVLHGGAAEMSAAYRQKMTHILRDSVVRFAEDNQAMVADGGTDTGIMQVMGVAYQAAGSHFPLVGISVDDGVTYPDGPAPDAQRWALNAAHSHFVLVAANDFGAESHLLVGFARVGGNKGVALAINGGGITQAEIEMHARMGTPVICLKGTGRYADALAVAAKGSDLLRDFEQNFTPLAIFDTDQQAPEELYHLIRRLLYS